MKWLITLVLGVLIGALGVLFFLSKVPLDAAPPAVVLAPAIPVAAVPQTTAAAAGVALPAASLPELSVPLIVAVPATTALEPMPKSDALQIPVDGVSVEQLSDTFSQARGSERQHGALDIPAASGSRVWAVADGKVVKLFNSKPGGLTIYQFDPGEKYAYYYAHLQRYAAGIKEGQSIKRGQLIGYVGSSGNAELATPHLHFAIFELGPEKQWWKGTPVNPYPMLGGAKRP